MVGVYLLLAQLEREPRAKLEALARRDPLLPGGIRTSIARGRNLEVDNVVRESVGDFMVRGMEVEQLALRAARVMLDAHPNFALTFKSPSGYC